MTLHLEIITPERTVYNGEVNEITVPTITGQITILPHHVDLVTKLTHGDLFVKNGQQTQHIGLTGGFLEVGKNIVTILADYAVRSEEIEEEKAKEAHLRAKKKLEEAKSLTQKDFILAEGEFRRALLDLHIVNRRKQRI